MTDLERATSIGTPINSDSQAGVEVITADSGKNAPGLSWELSHEAKDQLREIDLNLRAAEQISGRLITG